MKIFLFDFDGTIAESGRGITNCVKYALEKLGRPVPGMEELRKFIGPPLFTSFCGVTGLSEEDSERAVKLYRERYGVTGLFETDVYPGIPGMLKKLKAAGAYVAVASGKPTHYLVRIIEYLGLSDCFDAVVGPDPSSHSSEKTEQIRRALPEGADPKDAWMIGDRCFDVDSGHALGMHSVAVGYGYGSVEEFEECGADRICMTVAELSDYLLSAADAD